MFGKMHSFALLLSICALVFHGNAQYHPYHRDGLNPYLESSPIADNLQYPSNLVDENRFLFQVTSLFTTTTTTTTTTPTTCTVFTNVACLATGRRRRSQLEDEDEEFIEPSPVDK
jgi:hypothetical protein